ncbi:MAG: exopolysaccharide biosynthesis protein [Cyanobacteria bacterium J06629_9]
MAKLSAELQRYFLDAAPSNEADAPTDALGADALAAGVPASSDPADVTLDELLSIAGERTFGFLFVMLSLPSALPVPAPGYSIPFGIVMALLAWQLIKGAEQPWLPMGWRKRGFKRKTVQGFIRKGLPWLRRIEAISRPRLTPICTSFPGRLAIGIAIVLMSCCMMIPIPGTNTLPAIGIFVTGFGLLDDDGVISLAGMTICAISLGLVLSIFILGAEVVDRGKDMIKDAIF